MSSDERDGLGFILTTMIERDRAKQRPGTKIIGQVAAVLNAGQRMQPIAALIVPNDHIVA